MIGRLRRIALLDLALAAALLGIVVAAQSSDPLPSWNDGAAKQAIVSFVTRATEEGGPGFIPAEDRIATFDNDGTLWAEKPVPNEVFFMLARVEELAADDPSLKERQPFKAALERDAAYFQREGAKAVGELMAATHAGMSQEQFREKAESFLRTARHPVLKRPYTETAFQPMTELLAYLRANGFETWICSGGTIDFMRPIAPGTYGVPPQQVIGTELKRESRRDGGRLTIWRLPALESFNDKDMKPVNIDRQIGGRPAFAAGNVLSGGDIGMLEYSKGRSGPSLQILIYHDDAEREFAYEEKDNASLNAAKAHGFTVVSVKNDWKTVFAAPKEAP